MLLNFISSSSITRHDIVSRAQAECLHAVLKKTGVPNKLATIHGAKHDGFSKQVPLKGFVTIRDLLQIIEKRIKIIPNGHECEAAKIMPAHNSKNYPEGIEKCLK